VTALHDHHEKRPLRLAVFGAMPFTGNLGVTALLTSLLEGLDRCGRGLDVTVFDDNPGRGSASVAVDGGALTYNLCGAQPTRRLYRPDSLWQIRLAGRLGGLGNTAIRILREADAVLDASGGDSFTDGYGPRRFWAIALPKLIALEQRRPLILLPQTIGPFDGGRERHVARDILTRAAAVWTRDHASRTLVHDLAGPELDRARVHAGVDLAFGLAARRPVHALPDPIPAWCARATGRPLIGLNVSGLLYHDDRSAADRFGLVADYRDAIHRLVARLLQHTTADVLLVPHVCTRRGHHEDDVSACATVAETLAGHANGRIAVLPAGCSPGETKWIIGRTDWFGATRMHAAIAALSSGVPAAAIAYSDKTAGVFATCRQTRHVVDARTRDADGVVGGMWVSWTVRERTRAVLDRAMPVVRRRVERQIPAIVDTILSRDAEPAPVERRRAA
jgi:polysaccharide pyruvyl transferase WcaK-like protein